MVTLKDWINKGDSWFNAFPEPCEIDKDLFAELTDFGAAIGLCIQSELGEYLQSAEFYDVIDDVAYTSTFLVKNGRFFSLGILPRMERPKGK